MENQIYRIDLTDKKQLEFYIVGANSPEPYYKQKEIGVIIFGKDELQLDAVLDLDEVESLIDYLQDAKRHCEKYNSSQKPKDETK